MDDKLKDVWIDMYKEHKLRFGYDNTDEEEEEDYTDEEWED